MAYGAINGSILSPDVTDFNELVARAMQDAWDEICDDTGCHPLDIEQLGCRKLSFNARHWAAFTATRLRAALAGDMLSGRGKPITLDALRGYFQAMDAGDVPDPALTLYSYLRMDGYVSPAPQSIVRGWLYDNEDTGREYSHDHPVESGTVPDATNIQPATADNLLTELKSSWKAWNEDRAELHRMIEVFAAAREYVASVNGEPEKDCWDTEDGKEAPGAERFASDWSWKAYDDKKQKAFDDLCAALSALEGSTE